MIMTSELIQSVYVCASLFYYTGHAEQTNVFQLQSSLCFKAQKP